MKKIANFLFTISFIIWLLTTLVLPTQNVLKDANTVNLLLVINNFFIIFFLIIKTLSDISNKKKSILNFKVGSTKKNN